MRMVFSSKWISRATLLVLGLVGLYLLLLIVPYFTVFFTIIRAVIVPLLLSLVIAYLLHPIVDVLMKLKLGRTIAILLMYLVFIGGIALLIWLAVPVFLQQVRDFIQLLPQLEETVYSWYVRLDQHLQQLPDGVHHSIDRAISSYATELTQSLGGMSNLPKTLANYLFPLVVVPFIVFYLLKDVRAIQKGFMQLIPPTKQRSMMKLWKEIDFSLGEYIRGQIVVSILVGVLSLIGFLLIQLPYALLLAVIAGIANIIPYFGPFIGLIPAVATALMSNPSLILWVIIIGFGIQIVEGNLLAPWIVGKKLHIHPLLIIITLIIGAEIGGIVGLILAVPLFVIGKVIVVNSLQLARRAKRYTAVD